MQLPDRPPNSQSLHDRLLQATAECATVLLSDEDFDRAVNNALKILAESAGIDRIGVSEHLDDSTGQTLGGIINRYEWHSPHVVSQLTHPSLSYISYEGVEEVYEVCCNGQHWGGLVEAMSEPFRSGQQELGVKSTYAVPIVVAGQYWGFIGLDYCQTPEILGNAELAALKTAAACIGSAIQRDRSRKEREAAVLERSQELEEYNQTLKSREQWLEATAAAANALLSIEDLDAGINEALRLIGETIGVDRVCMMQYIDDSAVLGLMRILYEWDSLYASSLFSHPELNEIGADGIEDWFVQLMAGEWVGGTVDELEEPFRSVQIELGVQSTYAVPIFINSQFWGILAIDHCREKKRLSLSEIAVFKTTASCIGSAIQQNQTRQARETAERAILDERNRLARDIHDTLAQAFTGISLQLEAAKDILPTQPTTAQTHLRRAGNLARDGLAEARRSVYALRAPILETHTLPQALQQLLQNLTAGTTLHPEISIDGTPRPLTPELENNLLRITQESLTNALRHAQAQTFHLTLIFDTQEIHLQIQDDGSGFDPQQSASGFGLLGIQERIAQMQGTLALSSKIGQGTTIAITVPSPQP